MIRTRSELKEYIHEDEMARFGSKGATIIQKIKKGDLWTYNVCLRKLEYYTSKSSVLHTILKVFYRARLTRLSCRTGWTIPPNVAGPGLLVVHRGTVVISPKARIGKNCRIHVCVNIGDWDTGAPVIGDNVYIGPGAKLFGNIEIASNIAIGANAVVNKSFFESGISIGGIPAKKISSNGNIYREIGKY